MPDAVGEDHHLEALVRLRIADDAHEGRQARAGAEQVQPLARQQVVEDQRAGRLAADEDRIPGRMCCRREVSGPFGTLML